MHQEISVPVEGEAENEVAGVVENRVGENEPNEGEPAIEVVGDRTELAPNLEAVPEAAIELPDKYKNEDGTPNVQALLKSNLELEKVMHANKQEKPETELKPATEATIGLEQNMVKWADVIHKNDGVMSDEVASEIAKAHNVTPELARSYWEGENAKAQLHVIQLHQMAGGADKFDKMVTWAAKSLGLEQANAFIDKIDVAKRAGADAEVKVTMDGMMAQYEAATGKKWAPELTGRDVAGQAIQPFANRAERSAAVRSKEYQSGDEAFHRLFDQRAALTKQRGIF